MWFKSLIYIIGSNLVQAAAIVSDSQISYLPFGCIEVEKKNIRSNLGHHPQIRQIVDAFQII